MKKVFLPSSHKTGGREKKTNRRWEKLDYVFIIYIEWSVMGSLNFIVRGCCRWLTAGYRKFHSSNATEMERIISTGTKTYRLDGRSRWTDASLLLLLSRRGGRKYRRGIGLDSFINDSITTAGGIVSVGETKERQAGGVGYDSYWKKRKKKKKSKQKRKMKR